MNKVTKSLYKWIFSTVRGWLQGSRGFQGTLSVVGNAKHECAGILIQCKVKEICFQDQRSAGICNGHPGGQFSVIRSSSNLASTTSVVQSPGGEHVGNSGHSSLTKEHLVYHPDLLQGPICHHSLQSLADFTGLEGSGGY